MCICLEQPSPAKAFFISFCVCMFKTVILSQIDVNFSGRVCVCVCISTAKHARLVTFVSTSQFKTPRRKDKNTNWALSTHHICIYIYIYIHGQSDHGKGIVKYIKKDVHVSPTLPSGKGPPIDTRTVRATFGECPQKQQSLSLFAVPVFIIKSYFIRETVLICTRTHARTHAHTHMTHTQNFDCNRRLHKMKFPPWFWFSSFSFSSFRSIDNWFLTPSQPRRSYQGDLMSREGRN